MYYLYVGYYVNDNTFSEILNKKINNMSVARQKFEYNIIRGLQEQLGTNISFVSYVPTDGELVIPVTSNVNGATVYHIAIQKNSPNSMLTAYIQFRKLVLKLGVDKLKSLRVIMYAVIPPFEQALLSLKKKYEIKISTICSEVPEMRRYSKSIPFKIKKRILTYYNEQFDGYIFFSKAMKDVVRINKKPYIVMEGIAPDECIPPISGKKNIVMYAGGLAKDNNVPYLIECCKEIDEIEEIWVCGVGYDEKCIQNLALSDSRIKYFGQVQNQKVLEMETQAKVLVNFRNPNEELTRFSFPSKILEYISSGSLVMSTRLEGIPDEYFNHIIEIDITDKSHIIRQLRYVMLMNEHEYLSKCVAAQLFIKNKNKNQQCNNIISFIENL